jgi:hypothetical protein
MNKPLMASEQQQIVDLVRSYLLRHQNNGLSIDILEQSVRHDGNWWYVPVRPNVEPRTYQYYDILADVETEIVDNEHINILLVPSS